MPTLVVQMGHCYRKSGATGTTGEQQYAAKVGEACMRLLNGRGGWTVNTTLADENDYRGSAFVAIHCDGSTSPTARGASIGYRTPEGQALGQAWKRAYAARGWPGFRPDNYTSALSGYYGTGNAVAAGNRRAFIAECGFRTNAQDRALLDAPGGPERVALSIGDALGIPLTPPGGFLMSLSDKQQKDVHDRVMGFLQQRWYLPVLDDKGRPTDAVREVPQGTPGAIPAAALDSLDGNYLTRRIAAVEAGIGDAARRGIADYLAANPPTIRVELDYAALAKAVNDDADQRRRDGNPNTGPLS